MKKRLLIAFLIFFGLSNMSFASIKIDAVKTTVSTCTNNGSITVFAITDKPQIFYSIIAGPVTQPTQTNNTFSSLPPGNYTVKVIDAASETATKQNVIITGNYIPISFKPIAVSPSCKGNADGQIIGNITPGTSYAPYSWQLTTAPIPIPQANDTFKKLPAGIYTVRLTDACGNYSASSISISDPNTQSNISGDIEIKKVGCDSVLIYFQVSVPVDTTGFQRLPLTYKYQTKNGTYIPPSGSPTTRLDTSAIHLPINPYQTVFQLLPRLTYGDTIIITVYNTCGDSSTSGVQFPPCGFYLKCNYNCDMIESENFIYIGTSYGLKAPVTYSVTNVATNELITDSTILGNTTNYFNLIFNLPSTKPIVVNTPYKLKVTDGCAQIFTNIYTVPPSSSPSIESEYIFHGACIDSVVVMQIIISGFRNDQILILLSGPTSVGSSKPDFSYNDTYKYPDTVFVQNSAFYLENLVSGTYQYTIKDRCGNTLDSSFTIKPSDIIGLQAMVSVKKGCAGESTLYFKHGGNVTIIVENTTTGIQYINSNFLGSNPTTDSILNLPNGHYSVIFNFFGNNISHVNTHFYGCVSLIKTVTISDNLPPIISSSNSITCKESIHIELISDSTKGVPPFQYAITNPQNKTSPIQLSNTFTVSVAGTYTAHIFDACGNASVTNITVDTLSFLPVKNIASVCSNSVKLYYGYSAFNSYSWTKGNKFYYTGDTLNIPFVTSADTGIYAITKVVNINGCTDTSHATYHLYGGNYFVKDINICKGATVKIGHHTDSIPGIYIDTLLSVGGCDSIIQSNITYITPKTKVQTLSGCNAVLYNGNTYTSSTILSDTLKSGYGCDSIYGIINILIKKIIPKQIDSIVFGCDNAVFKGITYKTKTIIKDTLKSNQGCDSIYRTVTITVTPSSTPSIIITGNDTICSGTAATFTATLTNGGNRPIFHWNVGKIGTDSKDSMFSSSLLNNYDTIGCTLTSNANCQIINSATSNIIKIVVLPNITPAISIVATNETVCVGNAVTFTATPINGGSNPCYQWQINYNNTGKNVDTLESSTLSNGDNVNCVLTNNFDCVTSKTAKSNTITMSVSDGNCDTLFVPTIFNPFSNVNTSNQVLRPFSNGNTIKKITFKVFNRYGKLLFESHDLYNAWDGRVNGFMEDVGTFVWTLTYTKTSGKRVTIKGTTVLIH